MSNQTHLTRDELLDIVKIQSRTIATLIQEKQDQGDKIRGCVEDSACNTVAGFSTQRLVKQYTQEWDDSTDIAAHYEDDMGWVLGIDCCDHEGTVVISDGKIEELLDEVIGDPTQD